MIDHNNGFQEGAFQLGAFQYTPDYDIRDIYTTSHGGKRRFWLTVRALESIKRWGRGGGNG